MAENQYVNKVVYGTKEDGSENVLINLADDTIIAEKLGLGLKAHNAAGAPIEGTSRLTITKYATGTFTSPGTTIDKIKITSIGFKPKIFMIYNDNAILSGNTSPPYNLVGAASIYGDDYTYLNTYESHVTYFVLKSNSGSQPAQGGHSSGNFFSPIEGGVQGNGTNVKMASSVTYVWFAWA